MKRFRMTRGIIVCIVVCALLAGCSAGSDQKDSSAEVSSAVEETSGDDELLKEMAGKYACVEVRRNGKEEKPGGEALHMYDDYEALVTIGGASERFNVETDRSGFVLKGEPDGKKTEFSCTYRSGVIRMDADDAEYVFAKEGTDRWKEAQEQNAVYGEYTLFAVTAFGATVEPEALELSSVLTLEADGTGYMTINDDGGDVEKWEENDGKIIVESGLSTMEGTVENGIITLDMDNDTYMHFAKEGADTSHLEVMTAEGLQDALTLGLGLTGMDYYYGLDEDDGYDLEQAIICFESAAEEGNGLAWYYRGLCYERQGEDDARYENAMECYEKAIKAGCLLGYVGKGNLYREGKGQLWDYEEAERCYQEALKKGCVEANYGMGMLYHSGTDLYQDDKQAASFLEKALESDDFGIRNEARVQLGYLHLEGLLGDASDAKKGMSLIEEAVSEGHGHGLHAMGYLYDEGTGVKQDYQKAVEWYERAASETGWPTSYSNLGCFYMNGKGVEQDAEKTLSFFRQGAAAGDSLSFYQQGYMYLYGDNYGITTDVDLAVAAFEKSSVAGEPDAYRMLGWICCREEYGRKDMEQALSYWELGALGGDAWSMYYAGYCYGWGEGTEQNADMAITYLGMALGHAPDDVDLRDSVRADVESLAESGIIDWETAKKIMEQANEAEFGDGNTTGRSEGHDAQISTFNIQAVENNPKDVAEFTMDTDMQVDSIMTYHWNNGKGKAPGEISVAEGDTVLGTWKAEGSPGSGAENVNWTVYPEDLRLEKGHTYVIVDSDYATWSCNAASGYVGFYQIDGTAYGGEQ